MIIVSDASPLIGLGRIKRLDILPKLFNDVIIPPAVAQECTQHIHKPGATHIQKEITDGNIIIFRDAFDLVPNLSKVLGKGEVESISLAVKLSAPILIDEKKGRTVAKLNKLDVIGIGGILVAAKEQKIISSVVPILERLSEEGYRISKQLQARIIKLSGD